MADGMTVFGIAGWSGSGKTTLIVKLLREFVGRDIAVSTLKHAHHSFDIDTPGKDSFEHRAAGASEVMVASGRRWALMHENEDDSAPSMDELIARMTPVDLLLIEGYKGTPYDKLEVHRIDVGKPLLCGDDPRVVAVASDRPVEGVPVPVLDLNDAAAIAEFILRHCGLGDARRGAA